MIPYPIGNYINIYESMEWVHLNPIIATAGLFQLNCKLQYYFRINLSNHIIILSFFTVLSKLHFPYIDIEH